MVNYGNTHEMQKSFCPASHKFLSRISQMGYLSRSLLACLLALISIPSLISLGQYAFSSARMVVFLKSMVWPVEWWWYAIPSFFFVDFNSFFLWKQTKLIGDKVTIGSRLRCFISWVTSKHFKHLNSLTQFQKKKGKRRCSLWWYRPHVQRKEICTHNSLH